MEKRTKTQLSIAALIYWMTNAVIFGIGIIIVLSVPGLQENAAKLIPLVVVASFVLAVPVAWLIAPRLRARYQRKQEQARLQEQPIQGSRL
jgi:hypothetical protein